MIYRSRYALLYIQTLYSRLREVPSGMTCKPLALATVAFHLAWSTLTWVGVESTSAQTTPSPSPPPSAIPTPESTPSTATLGSGPAVVITYKGKGKLVEFSRYQSGGYYVVEIPEACRSRLIRGDWSACASKNGVTVWSFPNRPGTQAILRHSAGRIEITFAEDLPTPGATPSSVPPKAVPPVIEGEIEQLPTPGATPSSSVPPKAIPPVIEREIERLPTPGAAPSSSVPPKAVPP
jgi:hypothetical protein